jgi:hypothetical protein
VANGTTSGLEMQASGLEKKKLKRREIYES